MDDIFESSVRSQGDLCGVVEGDSDTIYFYLYDLNAAESRKVRGSIYICSARSRVRAKELAILWDSSQRYVAVRVRGVIWAAFDTAAGAGYGGNYAPKASPVVPESIVNAFTPD